MKTTGSREFKKILIFFLVIIAVLLGLRFLKQYIYLSFTLLSLKFVWLILIVLAFLTLLKKRT